MPLLPVRSHSVVPRRVALPANIHKPHVLAVFKVMVCHIGIRGGVSVYSRRVVAVAAADCIVSGDTVHRVDVVVAGRGGDVVSARSAYNSVVAFRTVDRVVAIATYLNVIAATAEHTAGGTVVARSTPLGVVASH